MCTPPTHAGTVARLSKPDSDAALRAYLLAEAVDFRRMHVEILLDDPVWRDYAWRETSKAVDRLASGAEHPFHGWELPDGHPAWVHGVYADFVLGADDVVRLVEHR